MEPLSLALLLASGLLAGRALAGDEVLRGERLVALFARFGELAGDFVERLRHLDAPGNESLRQSLLKLARDLHQRQRAGSDRACGAQLRMLTGAIEMYNLDHSEPMRELDLERLVSDGYLKTAPRCPGGGRYLANGSLEDDPAPLCSLHGSIDDLQAAWAAEKSGRPDPRSDRKGQGTGTGETDTGGAGADASGARRSPEETVEVWRQTVLELIDRGIFAPAGGLWAGLDPRGGLTVVAQARVQPTLLWERMIALLPPELIPAARVGESQVLVELRPLPWLAGVPLRLEIHPDGLVLQGQSTGFAPAGHDWDEFLALTRDDNTLLLLEADGRGLLDRLAGQREHLSAALDEAGQERLRQAEAWGHDERVRSVSRLRLLVGRDGTRFYVSFINQLVRAGLKMLLTFLLPQARMVLSTMDPATVGGPVGAKVAAETDPETVAQLQRLLGSLEMQEKDGWLGIGTGRNLPLPLLLGLLGVAGGLAVNAWRKRQGGGGEDGPPVSHPDDDERPKTSALSGPTPQPAPNPDPAEGLPCRACERLLLAAASRYEDDHPAEAPRRLAWVDLVAAGVLPDLPACPHREAVLLTRGADGWHLHCPAGGSDKAPPPDRPLH